MKNRILSWALILYGITAFALVITIVIFAFDLNITYPILTLHGLYVVEKSIIHSIVVLSRQAYPHLFGANVFVIVGSMVYGLAKFTQNYLLKYAPSPQAIYSFFRPNINDKWNKLFVFIMITGVLITCLSIEELGLRLAGVNHPHQSPYYVNAKNWLHVLSGNSQYKFINGEFTHTVKTNPLGFVDQEWSVQKHDSVRIACFGDSFTEGWGAPPDSCYPRLLQSILPNEEVMNFGIAGSDPVFGYMVLNKIGLHYHPDIVTLTINQSDINDIIVRGGFERFRPDNTVSYRAAPWWEGLYQNSGIACLFLRRSYDLDTHLSPRDMPAETQKSIRILEQVLDSFHTICAAKGARCIFIFHPCQDEVERKKMDCESIMRYAQTRRYEVVDMLEGFNQSGMTPDNAKNYFWLHDKHNNAAGYLLFAKVLHGYLAKF